MEGLPLEVLLLEVPEGGLQAALGEKGVLQALQEGEHGGLVVEHDRGMGYAIVANQDKVGRLAFVWRERGRGREWGRRDRKG